MPPTLQKISIELAKHIGIVSGILIAVFYNIAKDAGFECKLIGHAINVGLILVMVSFLCSTMVIFHHLRFYMNANPNLKDLKTEIRIMVLSFMFGVGICLLLLWLSLWGSLWFDEWCLTVSALLGLSVID